MNKEILGSLAAVGAVAGVLVGVVALSKDHSKRGPQSVPHGESRDSCIFPTREPEGLGEVGAVARTAVRAPVQVAASTVEVGSTPRIEPPDFAAKYAGLTRSELGANLHVLSERRQEMQKRITVERRQAGQFTKVYPGPDGKLDLSVAKTEADRRYPSGTPFAIHLQGKGGSSAVEVTGIPKGEYPDFDAMQTEEIWLHQRLDSLPPD